MHEQTGKVVERSGSAGKEADTDPPSWKITEGDADTSDARLGTAQGRTLPNGAGLRASITHPLSSGDYSHFVVGCHNEEGEAAEPLLGDLASTGDCTSEPGDKLLTLGEKELEVRIGLMNLSDVTDLCISDVKSSSKATLNRTQPLVELCPIPDQKSCSLSQVVDKNALFGVLYSTQEGGESSVKPCLSLVQGATHSSPCPSMDKRLSPGVLTVLPVYHSLEERASSRLLCSPMEQGMAAAVLSPLVEEKASSTALGSSLNPGATSSLFHPYAETKPSAVPCPNHQQRTMPAVLYPSLETRVPTEDQCHYPEEHRHSDGHSSPLHHREACPATNTFVAAHIEVSPGQQTAETSFLCMEDEEADHQEECPICTEQYDTDRCRQALLNCQHVVCDSCVKAIMDQSGQADIGRVRCPICRQKTPMMKWEILKLQETMLEQDCTRIQTVQAPFTAASRRPGLWGALEYNFQQRFRTSRTFSCIPCLRYPLCFIERLNELERRNRCCYIFTLVLLYFAEKLCFVLPFLPILMLILIITLDTHT